MLTVLNRSFVPSAVSATAASSWNASYCSSGACARGSGCCRFTGECTGMSCNNFEKVLWCNAQLLVSSTAMQTADRAVHQQRRHGRSCRRKEATFFGKLEFGHLVIRQGGQQGGLRARAVVPHEVQALPKHNAQQRHACADEERMACTGSSCWHNAQCINAADGANALAANLQGASPIAPGPGTDGSRNALNAISTARLTDGARCAHQCTTRRPAAGRRRGPCATQRAAPRRDRQRRPRRRRPPAAPPAA